MIDPNAIRDEHDPFLREIYAAGWDEVIHEGCTNEIILVCRDPKSTRRIERINPRDYTIRTGVLPDGRLHSWIAESDGSAERFRDLIGHTY